MTTIKNLLAVTSIIILAEPVFPQQDFSDVEIQTVKVADSLYMLVGAGGNLSLSVGSNGVFLVDDQFAPLSEKILAAIAELTDKDVKFVVNTHYHQDHTGGNENIGKTGAVIVAHENVRARMSTEQFLEVFNQRIAASPPGALPIVTFPTQLNFYWNDTRIVAFHVNNAHTDGDAIIVYPDLNVFHMGDIYFNGMYPFIDVSSGGSLDGYISAVERVLGAPFLNDDTKFIPGHGPLSGVDELRTYLDLLRTARQRIQALIDDGLSEDEVVVEDPMREFNEDWGGGFMNPETFTRLAYQSLGR